MSTDVLCLIDGCDHKAYSRGLCQGCLRKARKRMESGRVKESTLIAKGEMLPKKRPPGRPPKSNAVEQGGKR